jgi:hypothetical protein
MTKLSPVVADAIKPTTISFSIYGKIYPQDSYTNEVLTKI